MNVERESWDCPDGSLETDNDMPFACCPHCEHKWQAEDWYDVKDGDTWECPKCEKKIRVRAVDYTVTVYLSTNLEKS